jgi:hypothetical protein
MNLVFFSLKDLKSESWSNPNVFTTHRIFIANNLGYYSNIALSLV